VAAAVGAASLAIEFAAVRVLAPWFGQSQIVWANALAVVLLALSLGQAIGGALAPSPRAVDATRVALGLAALWLVVASRTAPSVASLLAPLEAGGDRALLLSSTGSLAATVILFGPPVIAVGVAAPVWIHRLAGDVGPASAAARVFAAGTIGSLVGSYAAPLAAIPWLGSRATLSASAPLLALPGLAPAGARA